MVSWTEWEQPQAREWIAIPSTDDDKYSRGVLGIMTGSMQFPGAAVLGVEAAARTGVGMIRYQGPQNATALVLSRRPETVAVAGRVQGWLIGSGIDTKTRDPATSKDITAALHSGVPAVVDAGALDLVTPGSSHVVITPHYRELARLLATHGVDVSHNVVAQKPGDWAERATAILGVTVLLKGSPTHIATPAGAHYRVSGAPAWLATAGSGDVLGGILGALIATHHNEIDADTEALGRLAATASYLHGAAADRASLHDTHVSGQALSGGVAKRASTSGPIVALDIAETIPSTIAAIVKITMTHK